MHQFPAQYKKRPKYAFVLWPQKLKSKITISKSSTITATSALIAAVSFVSDEQ